MQRDLVVLIVGLIVAAGCGPPGAPGPSAGAARPAAAPAQSDAAYRQQVIEGARAEGEVNAALQSTWTPEGIRLLEDAIEREYGVRIRINFTPVQNYIQRFAELAAELAAGTTPSFDLQQTSAANAVLMLHEDFLEAPNWQALLPAGTPPGVVRDDGRLLVVLTDHSGLVYDPTVIPASEVPRSLKDLSNPRWRGRFMLASYPSSYIPQLVMLGRDETLAALRGAIQNGAVTDIYANEYTRFAAKEYPLVNLVASYYVTAQKRGITAAFTPLDFSSSTEHFVAVPKRVAHPNAAKLLAAVLVGPEGQRIAEEHVGYSNLYYDGSADYQIEQAALAAGFPSFKWWESAEAKRLAVSPDGQEIVREIERILKGG